MMPVPGAGPKLAAAPEYPAAADPGRFRWLTGHPYVAARERRLLARLSPPRAPLLEVGCGEGANLVHARALWGDLRMVGLDRAREKLAFARLELPAVSFLGGDALALPFRDGSFATVLLRDVLHHVSPRAGALAEAARVLAPGGRLVVLEASGEPLLARIFARLFAHERGLAGSRFEVLRAELGGLEGLVVERAERLEPFPIFRLLFHHRFGLPALGGVALFQRLGELLESAGARAGSPASYLLLEARVSG